MKVIGINGSPHTNGNTCTMITTVFKQLASFGIETELVQLSGTTIRGCIACFKCFQNKDRRCAVNNDDFNPIFQMMVESDGMILGSPTYFADITSELKALIDRAGFVARSNNNLFKHKIGAAIVAMRRAGGIHAFDTINHLFQISQMFIVGSTYWNIGLGRNLEDVNNDSEALATMEELGKSIAYLLGKCTG